MTTTTLSPKATDALEKYLKGKTEKKPDESPSIVQEEIMPTKKRKVKSKTYGDPNDYKVLTHAAVKEKQKEIVRNKEYETEDYIPVEIWFYFHWTCPCCKKYNQQPFCNMYSCYGPAWASIGVNCDKCKRHFNIIEDVPDED